MSFYIGWPQAIYLILVSFGLIMSIINHGKTTDTNAYLTTISLIIILFLLSWGGFFSN